MNDRVKHTHDTLSQSATYASTLSVPVKQIYPASIDWDSYRQASYKVKKNAFSFSMSPKKAF